jgi:hypothetical protein
VHIIVYLRVFATLVSWMLRFLIDNDWIVTLLEKY